MKNYKGITGFKRANFIMYFSLIIWSALAYEDQGLASMVMFHVFIASFVFRFYSLSERMTENFAFGFLILMLIATQMSFFLFTHGHMKSAFVVFIAESLTLLWLKVRAQKEM